MQGRPIGLEVHGFVGGLTNAEVTRLVKAGVAEGCAGDVLPPLSDGAGPPLSIIWHLDENGVGSRTVIITGRLFDSGRVVSFSFGRTFLPGAVPAAAFKYAVRSVTCSLLTKAGFLTGAGLPQKWAAR
jgi:hypothetical protein